MRGIKKFLSLALAGVLLCSPAIADPKARQITVDTATVNNNISGCATVQACIEAIDNLTVGTPPGGSTTQVQYNLSGAFAGDSTFTHDPSTGTVSSYVFNSTLGEGRISDTTYGGYIDFNDSSSLGTLRFGGVGNVNNNAFDMDFESTALAVNFSSSTGVTLFNLGSIGLSSSNYLLSPSVYGGSGTSSNLSIYGSSNSAPSTSHIYLNSAGFGNVGIGTSSAVSKLTIGSGTPTTAANGLNFGTDTTANLYRSASGTIKTDGAFTAVGAITGSNLSGTNTGDQTISDATISTTDITTNNFTTSKHGFVPKGTNVGNFLKDDGTWAAVAGSGSGTVNTGVTGYFAYYPSPGGTTVDDQTILYTDGTNVGIGTTTVSAGKLVVSGNIDATTYNKVTVTAPASSATLTIANGKTLTASNTLTLAGTDSTTITFQGTGTYISRDSTDTVTNKRKTRRVGSTTSSATPTINTDNYDKYSLTAQAAAITSFTTNLSGTPVEGDFLEIQIKDDGTARAITWGASFQSSGNVALPSTTVISTTLRVLFEWDSAASKWTCVAVA